jgi:hypothetical protein
MKQPDDNKTAELDLVAKRGRGRPALEHALTPSERAKRYRDAKRAKRAAGTTPIKQQPAPHDSKAPNTEITPEMFWETLTAFNAEVHKVDALTLELKYANEEAKTASALRTQLDFAEEERANAMTAYLAALKVNTAQDQKHKAEIEKLAGDLKFTNSEIKDLNRIIKTTTEDAKKARDALKKAAEREKELNRKNTLLLLQLNKLRDASQK